jgi:hypothetical protein
VWVGIFISWGSVSCPPSVTYADVGFGQGVGLYVGNQVVELSGFFPGGQSTIGDYGNTG